MSCSVFVFCLPSDIPPSGEPVSKSNRSKVSSRFPKLSRSHPREPRSLEPQSGDLWPFSSVLTMASTSLGLFCDSFLAYSYHWSFWRDYSCISLNPEKRRSLPRVTSWLTTLEGRNHFLRRILRALQESSANWSAFPLFCKAALHKFSFVPLKSFCHNEFLVCIMLSLFHAQFSVPERHGLHGKTIFFLLRRTLMIITT